MLLLEEESELNSEILKPIEVNYLHRSSVNPSLCTSRLMLIHCRLTTRNYFFLLKESVHLEGLRVFRQGSDSFLVIFRVLETSQGGAGAALEAKGAIQDVKTVTSKESSIQREIRDNGRTRHLRQRKARFLNQ